MRMYLSTEVDKKNIFFHFSFSKVYINDVFHSVVFSKVDRGSSTEVGISSFLHAHSVLTQFRSSILLEDYDRINIAYLLCHISIINE